MSGEGKSLAGLEIIFQQQINGDVKHLLCVIDLFRKYDWVKNFKKKNARTVIYGFIRLVNESKRQEKKLWVDQGGKFYNKLMKT